jgi:RNA polymerase sigma factor (sigma-70 family)
MKLVKKPWLNFQGKPLSKDELKQVSKTWDMATWEEYLKTLDVPQRETTTAKFDRLLRIYENSTAYTIPEVIDEEENPQNKTLNWAISLLPDRQKTILKLIYWEGYSESQVGEQLNIAKGTVNKLKDRALRHLKMILENPTDAQQILQKEEGVSVDFHMYRGPQVFYKLPFRLN